jgi:predicted ABC-type ATPase
LQSRIEDIPIEDRRLLVVIAGHNGAGKTTFYTQRLGPVIGGMVDAHVNADDIELAMSNALGRGRLSKEELEDLAGAEATRLRKQYLAQDVSFSFETVFSDPAMDKARFMEEARQRGYLVVLLAIGLKSIEKSKERVATRHARGGHNIRAEKLEQRYGRVLRNFALGASAASLAIFLDNSEDCDQDAAGAYWDIAFMEDGSLVCKVESPPAWWLEVERIRSEH